MASWNCFLKLSSIDPNRYVESKQAMVTRSRLKAFRISFRVRITLARMFPTMPSRHTVVWLTPSTQKLNTSTLRSSSSV